jgi:hypothetical protein
VLVLAEMKTKTYATRQNLVVFARFARQTLNVQLASPGKIMSVEVGPLNMNFLTPAAIAGIGAATLCADKIKSAVSPPTISIDASSATIKKTAAGGRTVKTSAITVQVYAKILASLTMSCLLGAAIKKHLI